MCAGCIIKKMEVQILNKRIEQNNSFSLRTASLSFLGIISAFFFGWFLKFLLESGGTGNLVWVIIVFVLFLIFFVLQTFLVSESGQAAFLIALQSFALGFIFINSNIWILIFIAVNFLILYSANAAGRKIINNSLKIRFGEISRVVVYGGIVAVALIVSAVIPMFLESTQNMPISHTVFEDIFSVNQGWINKFVPGFTTTSTLEEVANNISQNSVNELPQAKYLPTKEKQQLVNAANKSFYDKISGFINSSIDPVMKIPDIAFQAAKDNFMKLPDNLKNFVYVGIGALIFLTAASISWPIRIIVSFLAYIIYEILISLGFIRISLEDRSKEVIIL